jgi:Archaeal/vacuolar-type H+-ATPase subunit C
MMQHATGAAIISKTRALYGKRLKTEDWEHLLNCSTIKDVTAYLKSKTAYAAALSDLLLENVHRQELEILLHRRLEEDTSKLSHYDFSGGWNITHYLISMLEIDAVLHAVIRVISPLGTDFRVQNKYLQNVSDIDIAKLDGAEGYADILTAVSHTPYHEILSKFSFEEKNGNDYGKLENALNVFLYKHVYDFLAADKARSERSGLKKFFDHYVDITNYINIMRVKKSFGVSPQEIMDMLLPYGSVPKKKLAAMAEAETAEEAAEIMMTTRSGKWIESVQGENSLDELTAKLVYETCRRAILYGFESGLVMTAYVFLLQSEISALVHLIEGIRYGVPRAEVKKLIVMF